MLEVYRSLFSIDEIERDRGLQRLYWALIAGFFISFIFWVSDRTVTLEAVQSGTHVCLPYFQNCESLFFLSEVSWLSPAFLYAFLTLTLVGSMMFALRGNWLRANVLIWPAALWKIFYLGLLANGAGTDYEYFHLPVLFVFMISANKWYFSRLTFVVVYTLSATMKFDSSWIVGNYFSSLEFGLPLFPNVLVPFITNAVSIFEIFTPWLLLSGNRKWRWFALASWIAFHIYSVQLVDFRYPLHCLTMVLALFYEAPTSSWRKRTHKDFASYMVLATLYLLTLLPAIIPGDAKYNLKSMKMGVRMFDANHQCTSSLVVTHKDGRTETIRLASKSAMKRCPPYVVWYQARNICRDSAIESVSWKFNSSVNGGPFYTLVDRANICGTRYEIFEKNDWFLEPEDSAPVAGYPKRNRLLDRMNLSEDEMIFSKPEIEISGVQTFLSENLRWIQGIYWLLWGLVSVTMLVRHLKPETSR